MNLHRCKTAEIRAKKNTPFIAWLILPATPTLPAQPATLHCRIKSFALVITTDSLPRKECGSAASSQGDGDSSAALLLLLKPIRIQQAAVRLKEEINPVLHHRDKQGREDRMGCGQPPFCSPSSLWDKRHFKEKFLPL